MIPAISEYGFGRHHRRLQGRRSLGGHHKLSCSSHIGIPATTKRLGEYTSTTRHDATTTPGAVPTTDYAA